ncbi:MAG: DUF2911 domain-containing protein [Bacteroidetes bacterium]|nr:DUF2911 domain-containing protein [Bacteroidota bacterium]
MKKIVVIVVCILITSATMAQPKMPMLDQSPMDMCYYPVDYPILRIQDKAKDPLIARIIYGRPQKNGRTIFGDLVPYGSVWRLGANEATEIEFFRDVKINKIKVPKGRYTLYALPESATWTMILNKETNIWGAFKYDSKKDLMRTDVPVQKQTETCEAFSMVFEKNNSNAANLVISWENTFVKLPFSW